jgi:hypothetical protein
VVINFAVCLLRVLIIARSKYPHLLITTIAVVVWYSSSDFKLAASWFVLLEIGLLVVDQTVSLVYLSLPKRVHEYLHSED